MADNKINAYTLSRAWFDFCFENPEKIRPNHTAMYFFCVEHCNRLGWKKKFGLPTTMVMDAIGIRSYNTYKNTLVDLVEFGFIEMIEKSKNQYSSNIIALSFFNKALDKALDKALIKHVTKQSESTVQSIDESISSIVKQITSNQLTSLQINKLKKSIDSFLGEKPKRFSPPTLLEIKAYCIERGNKVDPEKFFNHYEANGWMRGKSKIKKWKACIITWEKNEQGDSAGKLNMNQPKNRTEQLKENTIEAAKLLGLTD